MPEPRVALVIPVLNEVDNIGPLLADCRGQDRAPDDVVVVDAGSTDGTVELLKRLERDWSPLTVLTVAGARPGQGRNAGVRSTDAAIVATLDAGSRIGPDWLQTLLAAHHGASGRAVAVGVAVADARTAFERAAGWMTLRGYKPPDRPGLIAREFLPAGRSGYCFTREAWDAAGGYPDDLAWGEDKIFLRRLRATGAEVVVATAAEVRWRPRGSLGAVYGQYRRYAQGDATAGVDRRNTAVTFALYAAGGALLLRAGRGRCGAAALLAAAVPAYLAVFVVPAARELGRDRALAWVPVLRIGIDVAKMHGFVVGSLPRRR